MQRIFELLEDDTSNTWSMEYSASSKKTEMEEKKNVKKYVLPSEIGTDPNFKRDIVWKNVLGFIFLHAGFFYGLYLNFVEAKWATFIYCAALMFITGMGITAGAHRLWSHKTYKAKLSLQLFLLAMQTAAGQNCMYIWARDHRQHHKYSDTDADPHNAKRGFFFSHMGWLMSRKHPLVIQKGKTIDMSDLEADPLVMFQMKYYNPLYVVLAMVIPVYIPVLLWEETLWNSFFISYFLRYVAILHITWTVNSLAHFYGNKPFDKNMVPVESRWVALWTAGEGWHNYHHAFPWDHKASEFGAGLNGTLVFLNLMAYFGLAYDLKEASPEMIMRRVLRTGDGSHQKYGHLSGTNNNNEEKFSPEEYAKKQVKPEIKHGIHRTG